MALASSLNLATPASAQEPEAVILLHGLARSSSSMNKLQAALTGQGYHVLNISYPSRSADIPTLSETTLGAALQDPTLTPRHRIHFVTHSLGGILVRYYFSHHTDPRLGRVVMLGPPNQGSQVVDKIGTWWAFRKINGPAGRQLGTASNSLPNRLGPVTFELGIIAGNRSINWINSAMIPGPDDGKVSIENTKIQGMKDHIVIQASHPFLMKNPHAIHLTLTFLAHGAFHSPDSPRENLSP